MAKNKKQKVNGAALERTKQFKRAVEAAVKNSVYAKSFKYEERGKKAEYCLTADISYEHFNVQIEYMPAPCSVDFKIHFEQSRYDFTIYDVFNYFNTADFELYYYIDCDSKSSIEQAVNNVFSVLEKYIMSIENIASDENAVNALQKQLEADLTESFGADDSWKTDDEELRISQDFLLPINYGSSKKALKALKKYERKNGLETLYERRLLKYLESGHEVHYAHAVKKKNDKKVYRAAKLKTLAVIFPLCAIIIAAAVYCVRTALYGGAYVPVNAEKIAVYCVGASAALCFFMWFAFGRRLVVKFAGEKNAGLASEWFDKWLYDRFEENIKLGRAFFCVLSLAVCALISHSAVQDIAFYDGYVKYVADSGVSVCTVQNKDLEIYKLEGYYSKGYHEYENGYAVSNGEKYYELGNLKRGGEAESRLLAIAEEYDIEIRQIETVNEL